MRYATKKQALLALIGLTPAMRALHKVIPRTVNGMRDGWTVVMPRRLEARAIRRAELARIAL